MAERLHVFDETRELGQVLSDFRLCDEGTRPTPDFNEATIGQVLDGFSHSGPTDRKALNQLFLGGQLTADRKLSAGDAGGNLRFQSGIKRGGVCGQLRHVDIMTS